METNKYHIITDSYDSGEDDKQDTTTLKVEFITNYKGYPDYL